MKEYINRSVLNKKLQSTGRIFKSLISTITLLLSKILENHYLAGILLLFLIYGFCLVKEYKLAVSSLLLCLLVYAFAYFSPKQQKHLSRNLQKLESLIFLVVFLGFSIGVFAYIYRDLGIVDTTTHKLSKSINDCSYFSAVTWTTLGYGDFLPSSESRFYAAVEALLGYLYMGVFVSILFDYFSRSTQGESSVK